MSLLDRMRRGVPLKVVRRWHLDGTIDGHDPVLVTFRCKGDNGWFRLTVASINLGRGYTTEQFLANVRRIMDAIEGREYVVLLLQEIDEADPSDEHKILRKALAEMFPGALQFVEWGTREPIVVIGKGLEVTHERKKMTMDQGTALGAPAGVGPRRFYVYCVVMIEGVRFAFGNQHPHRYSLVNKAVAQARGRGERIVRIIITALCRTCDIVIDGGDLNTTNYPLLRALGQKIAVRRRYDYIRFIITKRRRR